jgi:DNA-binding GntR family transcriptional regulator
MPKTPASRDANGTTGEHPGGAASNRAYDYLRTGILKGEIPVGAVLAEGTLAEKLGISRTPVREALRLLLQEELLETGPRRQLFVRSIPPEQRREIMLLREALERLAVSEAARHMPIDEIDYLRLTVMRQRRAGKAGGLEVFMDLDEEFHSRIASGASLPLLVRFLGQLRAFIRLMGGQAAVLPGRMGEVVAEHERIIDALEARDEEVAVQAMIDHLERTAAAVDAEDVAGEAGAA